MGLNYLGKGDNEETPKPVPAPKGEPTGMTFEDATKFVSGELDAYDEDTVREHVGEEGLRRVKEVEKVTDEIVAVTREVLRKRRTGDPTLTLDLYRMSQMVRTAVRTLTEDQVCSLIATGMAGVAQVEEWMDSVKSEDDEDDDED